MTLIVTPDHVEGRIYTPTTIYSVTALGGILGSGQAILEIDPEAAARMVGTPPLGVNAGNIISGLTPPDAAQNMSEIPPTAADAPSAEADDTGAIIDVMVVYTNAALQGGSLAQFQTALEAEIAGTNYSFQNSGVIARYRLVHVAAVTYTQDATDMETDLVRLQNSSDSYMDEVHTLRTTYKADLVHLIVDTVTGGTCGIAYLNPPGADASGGFGVTARQCFGSYTLAHELGHNLGSAHDIANAGGQGAYTYSYGYRDPGYFRTIMSYSNGCSPACPTIPRWSNPNLTYAGRVLGTANANNVLSINNMRSTIAAFSTPATNTAPDNDLFANARLIDTLAYTRSQLTNLATSTSDPAASCGTGVGKTVWYRFTATSTGTVRLSTVGSNFDTVLAAYTGAEGSLTQVGCDDNSGGSSTSSLLLSVTNGVTYHVLIGGKNGASGNVIFNFTIPSNDYFEDATTINTNTFSESTPLDSRTTTPSDPRVPVACNNFSIARSLWYKVTPTSTSSWTFTSRAADSSFFVYPTTVALYSGSNVENLTYINCNQNFTAGANYTSSITSSLTGGTTYYVLLLMHNAAAGASMAFTATSSTPIANTGVVQFSTDSGTVAENGGTYNAQVTLAVTGSGTLASPVTVNLGYTGTATRNTDYTAPNTVTFTNAGGFTAGTYNQNVTLTITDDVAVESTETAILTLSSPSGATLGTQTTHTASITDNDTGITGVVSFAQAASSVAENRGPHNVVVSLVVTGGTLASPVTVNLGYTGTALRNTDYTAPSTVTFTNAGGFTPGTYNQNVTLSLNIDTIPEDTETAILTLSSPSGATLGAQTSHTVSITNVPQGDEIIWPVVIALPRTGQHHHQRLRV